MIATGDDCTDRFHKLRGVRNRPPESRWKAIQINSNAPIMPSRRVSSSVALRKRARGDQWFGFICAVTQQVLGAKRRASKGDGPGASAASFEGRFAATSG